MQLKNGSHTALGDRFPPTHRFLYKSIPEVENGEGCFIDIFLPSSRRLQTGRGLPLAFFIHGGGFCSGSTQDLPFNQINYFLSHGFVVSSIEYRLAPHVTHYQAREDILDAWQYTAWTLNDDLRKVARKDDGASLAVDVSRIITDGGSAGGTSTLFLCIDTHKYNSCVPDSSRRLPEPVAIICSYPLVNVDTHFCSRSREEYHQDMQEKEGDIWRYGKQLYGQKATTSWPFHEHPEYCCNDPRCVWTKTTFKYKSLNSFLYDTTAPFPPTASVIHNLHPEMPPLYILAAEDDSVIPVEQSYELQQALKRMGSEVHLGLGKGAFHGWTTAPSKYWPEDRKDEWWAVIHKALEWARGKVEL